MTFEIRAYRSVSSQNISQSSRKRRWSISGLSGFEAWTENPRVGGSIPPLAPPDVDAVGAAVWINNEADRL
jgi:hypothetical protein